MWKKLFWIWCSFLPLIWAQSEDEAIFIEEETEVLKPPPPMDEVEISVNGNPFQLTPEIYLQKGETLQVKVKYLKPMSFVAIAIDKAEARVHRRLFRANQAGELELEVRVPDKRLRGVATVEYFTSSNKHMVKKCKVFIR